MIKLEEKYKNKSLKRSGFLPTSPLQFDFPYLVLNALERPKMKVIEFEARKFILLERREDFDEFEEMLEEKMRKEEGD